MIRRFVLIALASTVFAASAGAEERNIYAAMKTVAESQDGASIAQSLISVGNTLTEMSVAETIAFRISLSMIEKSGQAEKGTAEHGMLSTLWQSTSRHLFSLCSIDKSPETVVRVNLELGRPYRCSSE